MNERGRAYNDLLARLDRTYLSERVLACTSKFYAAVSTACDIRCPYCPRQYHAPEISSGVMKLEDFRKLAPALQYSAYTGLFGLGEPFLNRDFLEFIRLAKEAGAFTATSTHGMSLTREAIERLIELGLDELEISIDAPKRRLFEFLRAGAKFDKVLAAARNLRDRKAVLRKDKPRVFIGSVISRHNVRTMPALVELAKELGAGRIVFTDLIIVDPNNKDLSVAGTRLMGKYVAKARKMAAQIGQDMAYFRQNPFPWTQGGGGPVRDLRTNEDAPIVACAPPVVEARDGHFGCPELWGALVVERNGDAKTCCYIADVMGNAFQTPPEEVENGEPKRLLRRAQTLGQLPGPCRDCCNLIAATPERVAKALEDAATAADAAASAAAITAAQRRDFETLLAQYRRLFSQREGF